VNEEKDDVWEEDILQKKKRGKWEMPLFIMN
jgi:hypothetical protein